MRSVPLFVALLVAFSLVACGGDEATDAGGQGNDGSEAARSPASLTESYDHGLDFLAEQFEDDGWIHVPQRGAEPGITAFAIANFADRPGGMRPGDRELVDATLDNLVAMQKDDGGIYETGLANYYTCAAVLALKAGGREKDVPVIERAVTFLKGLQFDEGQGVEESSENYGGLGYSEHVRPDLSNTQYNLEALRAGGVSADDPVFEKVVKFLEHSQNYSEANPGGVTDAEGREIVPGEDGGATYRPAESKAGVVVQDDGKVVLRSYGSMTYALLKCYLYAGVPEDDPRVQAAVRWIENNWTWKENPGFQTAEERQQGLYYYYSTAARALAALGTDELRIDGETHDWREELSTEIMARQREDGSWVNGGNPRWMESLPALATSYALVALRECAGS